MLPPRNRPPAAALRALLSAAVDYAGLFPPARLLLEPALRNYAHYLRSDDRWLLGAFVLPVEQFGEAERCLDLFDTANPLRVSALGKRTTDRAEFVAALRDHLQQIDDWCAAHSRKIDCAQFEMPLPGEVDAALLDEMRELMRGRKMQAFWEAPGDRASTVLELLAAHNRADAGAVPFGFKLRTGGVTADAFPDTATVARCLVSAAKTRVPTKFTAGLHHPVRQFHESVQTKMHGFLNVLGAGIFAAECGWDEAQVEQMLNEENPAAFSFTDHGMKWREHSVTPDRIAACRHAAGSFGSCSFDEPREDLRAMHLL